MQLVESAGKYADSSQGRENTKNAGKQLQLIELRVMRIHQGLAAVKLRCFHCFLSNNSIVC